jgi:hypothetical protein
MKSMKEVLKTFESMEKKNKNKPVMVARQKVGEIFVGLSPKTLANLHSKGEGPPVYKRGRLAFYKIDELTQFMTADEEDEDEDGKHRGREPPSSYKNFITKVHLTSF